MDAYEATRIVFSRIQNLDPDNAAKIMGLLLIQGHGEKEMIRLAFGPEALLHSVVVKACKDLGLLPSSSPATPSGAGVAVFSRQNSARLLPASPSSWEVTAPFSVVEDLPKPEKLLPPSLAYGGGDLIDELKLQDQLSFLDEGGGGAPMRAKSGEIYYLDIAGDYRSPSSGGESMLLPNSMGWGTNGRSGSIADLCLSSSDLSGAGFGWRPCLYFARGYCKNGNACRFLHDDAAAIGGGKMDAVFEQEMLLRSKNSRLMASAAPFPYSPTSTVPPSPSSPAKYMNFLLQHQNDTQRAAAATAAALMLNRSPGNDELHKFMGRSRADFAGISNAGSRQIYLTFPADSTFREEDVSNYFSIYGPVQDVRIPYQQKRMFGFVTFVYTETVKLILAKGNPHFVCDARVLVKPYKEKGKVLDKKQPQAERLSFSGCSTPTGVDSPFDLGGRMFYNIGCGSGGPAQDALVRRLMEQQQAELLQQAIELQGKRFELMDFKTRNFSAALQNTSSTTSLVAAMTSSSCNGISSPIVCQQEGKRSSIGCGTEQQPVINADDKEKTTGELNPKEDINFQESTEHNLPDSPFASPTKASSFSDRPFSPSTAGVGVNNLIGTPLLPSSSTLSSCFFQMPARSDFSSKA